MNEHRRTRYTYFHAMNSLSTQGQTRDGGYETNLPFSFPVFQIIKTMITRWISYSCLTGSPLWWRHQIEIFSALLALCENNPPVTDRFPSHRPVTRSFDVFFICAWVNNRDAGGLRRHRSHYDVTVMTAYLRWLLPNAIQWIWPTKQRFPKRRHRQTGL